MCRAVADGGRRCGCAVGLKRRSADRSRYANNKAVALELEPIGGGGEVPVEDPLDVLDKITTVKMEVQETIREATLIQNYFHGTGEVGALRDSLYDTDTPSPEIKTIVNETFGIDVDKPDYWTEAMEVANTKVQEIGSIVHNEVIKRIGEPIFRDKEWEEAKNAELSELMAQARTEEDPDEREKLGERINTLGKEIAEAKGYVTTEWQLQYAEETQKLIAETRPMGNEKVEFHKSSQKPGMKAIEKAAKFFPSEWWKKSDGHEIPLYVRHTSGRAHYAKRDRVKVTSSGGTKTKIVTPEIVEKQPVTKLEFLDEILQYARDSVGRKEKVYDVVADRNAKRELLSVEWDEETNEIVRTFKGGSTTVEFKETDEREYPIWIENIEKVPYEEYRKLTIEMVGYKSKWKWTSKHSSGWMEVENKETGEVKIIATDKELAGDGWTTDTVGTVTTDKSVSVTVHELAHRMEDTNPIIKDLEKVYWSQRCTDPVTSEPFEGAEYKAFSSGAKKGEIVYPDAKFTSVYTSKRYDDGSHELLSTGMDAIFGWRNGSLAGIGNYEADESHRDWTLGMLTAV